MRQFNTPPLPWKLVRYNASGFSKSLDMICEFEEHKGRGNVHDAEDVVEADVAIEWLERKVWEATGGAKVECFYS
jgi:hypothetical protein